MPKLAGDKKDADTINNQRCDWLAAQVREFSPTLVIIDVFAHFIKTKRGVNDYDTMMDVIALLQDKFKSVGYDGAVLLSLHARKQVSEDVGDDGLGSTAIRASISDSLHFKYHRKQKLYTVESDQTFRDQELGELEETIVNRDSATGRISLGASYGTIRRQEKAGEFDLQRAKLYHHVEQNPGAIMNNALAKSLGVSKPTLFSLRDDLEKQHKIVSTGKGKKGDPQKWSVVSAILESVEEVVCNSR